MSNPKIEHNGRMLEVLESILVEKNDTEEMIIQRALDKGWIRPLEDTAINTINTKEENA